MMSPSSDIMVTSCDIKLKLYSDHVVYMYMARGSQPARLLCFPPTEKQYVKAREHFLYAEQPKEFGCMLVELATTFGYSGEADLFIAQAVLQ